MEVTPVNKSTLPTPEQLLRSWADELRRVARPYLRPFATHVFVELRGSDDALTAVVRRISTGGVLQETDFRDLEAKQLLTLEREKWLAWVAERVRHQLTPTTAFTDRQNVRVIAVFKSTSELHQRVDQLDRALYLVQAEEDREKRQQLTKEFFTMFRACADTYRAQETEVLRGIVVLLHYGKQEGVLRFSLSSLNLDAHARIDTTVQR